MIECRCTTRGCAFEVTAEDAVAVVRKAIDNAGAGSIREMLDELYGTQAGQAGMEVYGLDRVEMMVSGIVQAKFYEHLRENPAHTCALTWRVTDLEEMLE